MSARTGAGYGSVSTVVATLPVGPRKIHIIYIYTHVYYYNHGQHILYSIAHRHVHINGMYIIMKCDCKEITSFGCATFGRNIWEKP